MTHEFWDGFFGGCFFGAMIASGFIWFQIWKQERKDQ